MFGFPVLLEMKGRRCLVVGGGRVGRARAQALADAGAAVVAVEPDPQAAMLASLLGAATGAEPAHEVDPCIP